MALLAKAPASASKDLFSLRDMLTGKPLTSKSRLQGDVVKVRSYGKLADLLGAERNIEVDGACTIGDLRARLATACPDAAAALSSERVRACVGDRLVPDSHILVASDSVDLLAPVSGG